MDDKCIMENLLLTTKGVCDLYMHGTIEASTANVHQTFNQALMIVCACRTIFIRRCQQKAGIRWSRRSSRRL